MALASLWKSRLALTALTALTAAALALAACSSTTVPEKDDDAGTSSAPEAGATDAGLLCEPSAAVPCECPDKSAGTKLCGPDGLSFETCTAADGGRCPSAPCAPGQEVSCRCLDGTAGMKRCRETGLSYEPCMADGGSCNR